MHVKKQLLMLLICLIGGFGYALPSGVAAKEQAEEDAQWYQPED